MPTIRQKKAFKNIVENGRTLGEAMVNAGYSENTAIAPQKLTESKGFQELVAQYIPDDLISKKILMLIKHKDWRAVSDGIDKMLKIKGVDKGLSNSTFQQFNFNNLTDEQLQRAAEILAPKSDSNGATQTQS